MRLIHTLICGLLLLSMFRFDGVGADPNINDEGDLFKLSGNIFDADGNTAGMDLRCLP